MHGKINKSTIFSGLGAQKNNSNQPLIGVNFGAALEIKKTSGKPGIELLDTLRVGKESRGGVARTFLAAR